MRLHMLCYKMHALQRVFVQLGRSMVMKCAVWDLQYVLRNVYIKICGVISYLSCYLYKIL